MTEDVNQESQPKKESLLDKAKELADKAEDFFEDTAELGTVTEFEDTSLHGHAKGDRDFDGIHADVIHQVVGLGHIVEVVDAAIRSQGPDGLILET